MGDDDELGLIGHGAHIPGESDHVVVVQGGLDLVHDHEGGGAHLQNGEIQRDGHEGLLSAGQEGEHLQSLAGGLHLNLDAAVEDVIRVLQFQGGPAAAEELLEGLLERLVDVLEFPGEDGLHLPGNLGDHVLQLLLGGLHVVPLVGEVGVPLVDPLKLLDGPHVHIAQGGDVLFQLGDAAAGLGHRLDLHPLELGRLVGELVGLPQLVQQLLLLQGGGHLLLLQAGGLAADGQQLLVLLLALPGGLHPLPLQAHLLLVELGDGLVLFLVLPAQLGQPGLLLPDLPGEGLIFLLIVADEGPALLLVPGDVAA